MNESLALYRGKAVGEAAKFAPTKNGWIEGWFCYFNFGGWPLRPAIVPKEQAERGHWEPFEVDPETVGQFTGLVDKNGNKIFEMDILMDILQEADRDTYYVSWSSDDASWWRLSCGDGATPILESFDWFDSSHGEIIGNIHDNPELLKGE